MANWNVSKTINWKQFPSSTNSM